MISLRRTQCWTFSKKNPPYSGLKNLPIVDLHSNSGFTKCTCTGALFLPDFFCLVLQSTCTGALFLPDFFPDICQVKARIWVNGVERWDELYGRVEEKSPLGLRSYSPPKQNYFFFPPRKKLLCTVTLHECMY